LQFAFINLQCGFLGPTDDIRRYYLNQHMWAMGMFWAKIKLTAPSLLGGRFKAVPLSFASAALKKVIGETQPQLRRYERLAGVYHEYARTFCPGYVAFLQALRDKYGLALRSILDLACGAGTITTQLAHISPRVTGADISEAMLQAARKVCQDQPNVQFVQADFRAFCLNEQFDVVVCASDSLNYLHEPGELGQVLQCVSRHLSPLGLFVFDALDDRGFRRYSGKFVPIQIDGTECAIVLRYDSQSRVEHAVAVFGDEMELHRRIPIEPEEVHRAAAANGFAVLDWFSIAGFGLLKYGGVRNFYVLRAGA
jgi:SAM-dependent methyltransferase